MEAYFLEVSQGRLRENECESKFLVPEIYIRSYERDAWESFKVEIWGLQEETKAEVYGFS